jgi:hypothetical protein
VINFLFFALKAMARLLAGPFSIYFYFIEWGGTKMPVLAGLFFDCRLLIPDYLWDFWIGFCEFWGLTCEFGLVFGPMVDKLLVLWKILAWPIYIHSP